MKKKFTAVIAAFLAFAVFLGGCAAGPAPNPKPPVPDAKYAVVNNGSLAVQVGPYVYFVNGYAYPSPEGDNNVWGKVVRGGIYQAKFIHGNYDVKKTDRIYGEYTAYELDEEIFGAKFKDEYFSGFNMVVAKDADGEDLLDEDVKDDNGDPVKVQVVGAKPVVNKLLTGAGSSGGLYIFDGYIYFTSPNHNKDRSGNVMVNNVCFYRARLDGSGAQLLYSAQYAAMPDYAYYHYKGSLYLVVQDYIDNQNNLYSVKIGSRPSKPQIIAKNITGFVFQKSRSVYVSGAETKPNLLDDYIYYTRWPDKDIDTTVTGNVLERVRPDGRNSTRNTLLNTGEMIELLSVYPDALFYFRTNALGKDLIGSDLASYGDNGEVTGKATRTETVIARAGDSDGNAVYSNIYADIYYPNSPDNLNPRGEYFAIASRSGYTVCCLSSTGEERPLFNGESGLLLRKNNDFYFTMDGYFYEAQLFKANQSPYMISDSAAMSDGFLTPLSVTAGFAFFIKTDIVNVGYPDYPVANYLAARRVKPGYKDWQICVIDPDEIPEE